MKKKFGHIDLFDACIYQPLNGLRRQLLSEVMRHTIEFVRDPFVGNHPAFIAVSPAIIACHFWKNMLLSFKVHSFVHKLVVGKKHMAVIRAFIAIDLPASIHTQLDTISEQLQQQVKPGTVRWVPARNIHLTLKFLGEVSSTNLEMLNNLLRTQASRQPCFDISIGGLGAFPTIHRPRVIWIGVQAPVNLLSLQRSIESETQRLGYAAEERSFSAHLTLGRVSHNAQPAEITRLGELLNNMQVGSLGTVRVDTVRLFRSDLLPGGAVYTALYSAELSG